MQVLPPHYPLDVELRMYILLQALRARPKVLPPFLKCLWSSHECLVLGNALAVDALGQSQSTKDAGPFLAVSPRILVLRSGKFQLTNNRLLGAGPWGEGLAPDLHPQPSPARGGVHN